MKKLNLLVVVFSIGMLQHSFAQDTTKSASSLLLNSYYKLKNALVGSNANTAALSAGAFVTDINAVDKETLNDESKKALLKDAVAISQTKNISLQREKFAGLSANMAALVKTVKLSTDPVYLQYCPMKKASWLSDEKAIKNPYYGNAMLTCGSIQETIQ